MTTLRRVGLIGLWVVWTFALPVVAQEQTNEFRPVMPGELGQEQLPAAQLVFGAYAFVWTTFVVYLLLLWGRMKRVEADLREVSTKLGAPRG